MLVWGCVWGWVLLLVAAEYGGGGSLGGLSILSFVVGSVVGSVVMEV